MTDYKQLCVELLDSAEELDDLIEGIRLGDYMPDSFTLQPMRAVLDRARAALAEPEPDPADGEVAELVAWLRSLEDASVWFESGSPEALKLIRAADLLERMAPQPIPVTERLPEPEDCDAEGMCWWYCAPAERWLRCGIPEPDPASQVHTHWLPANALPLPKEVV